MYHANDFNTNFYHRTQVSQLSKISYEIRPILEGFKKEVMTPMGTKVFFETCSKISVFQSEEFGLAFDIINNERRFIYYLGTAGRKIIDFVTEDGIITDHFVEDEYFRKFLIMLMEAIEVTNLINKK